MPAIETLDDWNARLADCGCCIMPSCPIPLKECESISSYYRSGAFVNPDDNKKYLIETDKLSWYEDNSEHTYHEKEEFTTTLRGWSLYSGPCEEEDIEFFAWNVPFDPNLIASIEFVSTGGSEWTLSTYLTAILANFAGFGFSGLSCDPSTSCASYISDVDHGPGVTTICKSRYRWRIPSDHLGSYFKVTWDVVFFPTDGDPESVEIDKVFSWSGPGEQADPDGDSWVGDWYELPLSEREGETRVVNIRYQCYRSPFGNKPQVTGEAIDI